MRQTNTQKLIAHAKKCGVEFSADDKAKYHRLGRAALKDLVAQVEQSLCRLTTYEIRSSKGGPAVLGEIILHTPTFYVMIGGLNPSQVMYRSVQGMNDYRGGQNRWTTMDMIDNGLLAKLLVNLQPACEAA